jgi:hypothetical protein
VAGPSADANSTEQARQAQADAHDQQAQDAVETAPDGAEDDGQDDDGTSGDDLPQHARAAVQRANRQAAKARTELKALRDQIEQEAEQRRQAEMTAEQRAEAAEAKVQQALQRAERAERQAKIAQLVTQPDRVLRLMDDPAEYFPDGQPDTERILQDFPEYAPRKSDTAGAPPARATGAGGTPPRRATTEDQAETLLAQGRLSEYAALVAAQQQARQRPTQGAGPLNLEE